MSKINDVMDDEVLMDQVILVNGKPTSIRDVLDAIKKKTKDKKGRSFSTG